MSSSEHTIRILAVVQNEVKNGVAAVRGDIKGLTDEVKKSSDTQKAFLQESISLWAAYTMTVKAARFAWSAVEEKAKWDLLAQALSTMEGGAKEGAKSLEKLVEVSKLPGIGLEEAQTAYLRLRSLKIGGDEATHMLIELSNAIALAGGGAAEFNRVGVQMAQILGKPSVMQQDLNVIAESMPMIRTLMKDTFGETTAEGIRKLDITTKEFVDGLIEAMEALPRAQDNLQNTIEKVGLSWSLFKSAFVSRDFTMDVLSSWGDMLEEMTRALDGKAQIDWPGAMRKFLTGGLAGAAGYIAGGGSEQAAVDRETAQIQAAMDKRAAAQDRYNAALIRGDKKGMADATADSQQATNFLAGRGDIQRMAREEDEFRARFASLNVMPAAPKGETGKEAKERERREKEAYREAQRQSDLEVQRYNALNPTYATDRTNREFMLRQGYDNAGAANPNINKFGYDTEEGMGYSVELSDEYLEDYKKKNNELIAEQGRRAVAHEQMLNEMDEQQKRHNEEALRQQIQYADKYSGLLGGAFTQIWSDVRKEGVSTWEAVYNGFSEMLTKMVIEWLARAAVFAAFSAFSGPGALGGFQSYVFGAARAGGGPTYPGENYVKNERYGAGELFRPDTAGSISPNWRGSSAGSGIQIHLHGAASMDDARRVKTALDDIGRGRYATVVAGW